MKKLLCILLLLSFTTIQAFGATGTIILPVQSAKITGTYVTTAPGGGSAAVGASIDAGDGNWRLLFDDTTDEAAAGGWAYTINGVSSANMSKVNGVLKANIAYINQT